MYAEVKRLRCCVQC